MVEPRTSVTRATICIDTNRGEPLIPVGSISADVTTRLTHTNQIAIPYNRARIGDCMSVYLRMVILFCPTACRLSPSSLPQSVLLCDLRSFLSISFVSAMKLLAADLAFVLDRRRKSDLAPVMAPDSPCQPAT